MYEKEENKGKDEETSKGMKCENENKIENLVEIETENKNENETHSVDEEKNEDDDQNKIDNENLNVINSHSQSTNNDNQILQIKNAPVQDNVSTTDVSVNEKIKTIKFEKIVEKNISTQSDNFQTIPILPEIPVMPVLPDFPDFELSPSSATPKNTKIQINEIALILFSKEQILSNRKLNTQEEIKNLKNLKNFAKNDNFKNLEKFDVVKNKQDILILENKIKNNYFTDQSEHIDTLSVKAYCDGKSVKTEVWFPFRIRLLLLFLFLFLFLFLLLFLLC